jgi:hypothetical protein
MPFFNALLSGQPDSGAEQKHTIPQAMKDNFLDWLADETSLKDFEITGELGKTFEDLFAEIETELGSVSVKELDPRYVQMFLLT